MALSKEAADLSKKVYEYAEKLHAVSDDDSLYGIRKGGSDVVIGNPPYVQLQSMGEMSEILKNCGYETFDKGADLYCLFTERGYKLLKNGGIQSMVRGRDISAYGITGFEDLSLFRAFPCSTSKRRTDRYTCTIRHRKCPINCQPASSLLKIYPQHSA